MSNRQFWHVGATPDLARTIVLFWSLQPLKPNGESDETRNLYLLRGTNTSELDPNVKEQIEGFG
jgi:hypothetical protein